MKDTYASVARDPIARAVATMFEALEVRSHLSASFMDAVVDLPNSETAVTAPAQFKGKVDGSLWSQISSNADNGSDSSSSLIRKNEAGQVQTYVKVRGNVKQASATLRRLGADVDTFNKDDKVVQAWLSPSQMSVAAQLKRVLSISTPSYGISNAGAVTSEGDAAMRANLARSSFGYTGVGVKIGVISNGVDHQSNVVATGDLPPITVNPSLPGAGDEGTAMLEIIHDLAPGAQLYFSGASTSYDMVNSITYLRNQGCDIIVDDLGFYAEPFFEDGSIAQAVQSATSAGVVYVTAAGNDNGLHYQAQFSDIGNGTQNFSTGTPDNINGFYVAPGGTAKVILQWSDDFDASTNNYNLNLINTSLADVGTYSRPAGYAWEYAEFTNTSGSPVAIGAVITKQGGAASRELEMFVIGDVVSNLDYYTVNDATFGQAAVGSAIVVAASNAASPGTVESFSSRGGATVYTNFSTQAKTIRQTIDVTGSDAVSTKVAQLGYFPTSSGLFYGTSAAAPHVAAVAALVLQANSGLAPNQVESIINNTTADIDTGGYDTASGYGLVQADRAIAATRHALIGTNLVVDGSENGDNITLSYSGSTVTLLFNGHGFTFPSSLVASATIYGRGGQDHINIDSSITFNTEIRGGTDVDHIRGGSGQDTIYGEDGDDYLFGGTNNDAVIGGGGWDTVDLTSVTSGSYINLDGGVAVSNETGTTSAADWLAEIEIAQGGSGNDTLFSTGTFAYRYYGNGGSDTITGGNGGEILSGGEGNDTISGGGGDDTLIGSLGTDTLNGGSGSNIVDFTTLDYYFLNTTLYDNGVTPGSANLRIYANAAPSTVVYSQTVSNLNEFIGTGSSDTIDAGTRTQTITIRGLGGNDTVYGGSATDFIYGGTHNDTLYGGSGNDYIYAGTGDDFVNGWFGNDYLFGEADNDTIVGGYTDNGADHIWGGAGNDVLNGQDGNDEIYGDDNNWPSTGTPGDDLIFGESGDDYLEGDAGNDVIVGGTEDDTIYGEDGRDVILGGNGLDHIHNSANGSADDDIIITGTTSYDTNSDALNAIRAAWVNPSANYSARINTLKVTGVSYPGGTAYLKSTTVFSDTYVDIATGGSGEDWFLAAATDNVTDKSGTETWAI